MQKKKILPTLLRTVVLVIVSLVLGMNIYTWNAKRLTRDAVPMPFGYGASVVLSGSMEPALSVGDLLIVQERDSYEVGDIVVYQSGTMPVVHRIVEITEDTVTTRGDANNTEDAPVSVEALRGQVVQVIPFVGYLVLALKKPAAVIAMLILAVLLVEGSFRKGKAENKAEKEKIKAEIRALLDEMKEN